MPEAQHLIEKGGERIFVTQAELAVHLKDGWIYLGVLYPATGATVPQPQAEPEAPKPQGGRKSRKADEDEAAG